jgi:hypothetical protein
MSNERADLGFGSPLDDFNPNEWEPKAKPKPKTTRKQAATAAEKAAEATGFKSREPTAKPTNKRSQRRRTTGRNQQFNIKAKQETIEAFYAMADRNDWGLGETLEHALAALEKQQGKKG